MKVIAITVFLTINLIGSAYADEYMHGTSGTTYQNFGNTTYGSDGSSSQTFGNTTYGSGGTSSQRLGSKSPTIERHPRAPLLRGNNS